LAGLLAGQGRAVDQGSAGSVVAERGCGEKKVEKPAYGGHEHVSHRHDPLMATKHSPVLF